MITGLKAWALRHAQTAVGTLGRLSEHWIATAFMVLVIGIALALPACLQVILVNARTVGADGHRAVELSAYFKLGTDSSQAQQVVASVRKRDDVAEVRFISADEALVEFRKRSGFGSAIATLSENPLPHALVVRPRIHDSALNFDELAAALRQIPSIELVQLDALWVERLNAIIEALRRATTIIAVLLGLGVLVIVGNAIRADIHTRREEIEITKLVGGSDAFVRRPFLYSGIWFGLGGGVLALAITYTVAGLLSGPVRRVAALYGSDFELAQLPPMDALSVLGLAVALGWLGSYLAATRHLRAIEPR